VEVLVSALKSTWGTKERGEGIERCVGVEWDGRGEGGVDGTG
jgi:hypothetical protein